MTTAHAHRKRSIIAATGGLTAAMALAGCGLVPIASPPTDQSNPNGPALHPSGDQGAWLADGYAEGIGGEWVSDGMLCGIRDGVAIHRDISEKAATLIATEIATDTNLWRLDTETPDGVNCSPVLDDRLYTYETELLHSGEYRSIVVRVDLDTGERTPIYEAPVHITQFTSFAHQDETAYALAIADAEEALLAFDGAGQIAWQAPVSSASDCDLLSGHIICVEKATSAFSVFDASTGEVTASSTDSANLSDEIIFALDGYVIITGRYSAADTTYTAYDFNGDEIGELESANPPLIPLRTDGAYFHLEDFTSSDVLAVDVSGTPVLAYGETTREVEIVASGAIFTSDLPVGISADGQTIATTSLFEGTRLIDAEANEIATLSGADAFTIMDGYLTTMRDSAGVVYLPAG